MSNRFRKLERSLKGVANHRRLQFLFLLGTEPGMDLTSLANKTGASIRTSSEHAKRLEAAGLVAKKSDGRRVRMTLTATGEQLLALVQELENR